MSGFYITKCFLKLKEQEDCWWETTITKISTLKNLQDNLFFMYNTRHWFSFDYAKFLRKSWTDVDG